MIFKNYISYVIAFYSFVYNLHDFINMNKFILALKGKSWLIEVKISV
jgi:hypothetical protein